MDHELLNILITVMSAVFGGGGILTFILAKRERKAAADMKSANALDIMQKVYQQFVNDTAIEIYQLKEEIKMLRTVVENYKATCENCPNNKIRNNGPDYA